MVSLLFNQIGGDADVGTLADRINLNEEYLCRRANMRTLHQRFYREPDFRELEEDCQLNSGRASRRIKVSS